jgi:hypothetical protein
METHTSVRSIREFLELIWSAEIPDDTELSLFRGQADRHPLLPKLFRPPNETEKVRRAESQMLAFLKEVAPHLTPSRPENDWEWLSLGQHYGMSTRMSDWSSNPLVALFFAVESDPSDSANPVVYHYPITPQIVEKRKEESPLTIRHTRVFQPNHSHRSAAQAAWHVVHAIHQTEDGSFHFFPLETMEPHDRRISKIAISKEHVTGIRSELIRMGMNHSTIYGDFGSVCRAIAPSLGLS